MRSKEKILEAEEEYFDKIWYNRHLSLTREIELGLSTVDDEIWRRALEARKRIEEKYGKENLLHVGSRRRRRQGRSVVRVSGSARLHDGRGRSRRSAEKCGGCVGKLA